MEDADSGKQKPSTAGIIIGMNQTKVYRLSYCPQQVTNMKNELEAFAKERLERLLNEDYPTMKAVKVLEGNGEQAFEILQTRLNELLPDGSISFNPDTKEFVLQGTATLDKVWGDVCGQIKQEEDNFDGPKVTGMHIDFLTREEKW